MRRKYPFSRRETSGPCTATHGPHLHCSKKVWPRLQRKRDQDAAAGQVMFKRTALVRGSRLGLTVQETHQVTFAVTGDPVAQNQVVHPAADINRIDLYIPMPGERIGDPRVW